LKGVKRRPCEEGPVLCTRCQGKGGSRGATPRLAARCRPVKCKRCGAVILTVAGVAVSVGDDTLATLARFGLTDMRQPLLEPRPRPEDA
jgi:hypothetical protein